MKVEIDFPKRLYDEIRQLCDENGIKFVDYVVETVSDSYYTLKYGDLNVKLGLVKEEKVEKEPEKPKKSRTKKKVEVKIEKEEIKEQPVEKIEEKDEVVVEQTPVKRRRTLKAK